MNYPKDFLYELSQQRHRTIYSKITSLTNDEIPRETIEGRFTQGSVNVDGTSAMRRTCSLTMVTEDTSFSDFYWTQETKFKLEVGLKNTINPTFPEIIWFNQGIYLITTFNKQLSLNNCTISLSGKDKMCLLNGDFGGSLSSSVDFGKIEEESADGTSWVIRPLPIKEIILNLLHQYGGEPLHNIIINDLDTVGLELLEYRSNDPMYLYRKPESSVYNNITFNGNRQVSVSSNFTNTRALSTMTEHFETLVDSLVGSTEPTILYTAPNEGYYFTQLTYGQTAGYRTTELTYAGDLIANIGETLTSVLDKIKNMLGTFEYFYNLDGQFVFQRKKNVKNTTWQLDKSFGQRYEDGEFDSVDYDFNELQLITAFSSSPKLTDFKNDYAVWGKRTSASGAEIPVHYRYAIDICPTQYTSINTMDAVDKIEAYNNKHGTKLQPQSSVTYSDTKVDWREIIYQMAADHSKYAHVLDDFERRVKTANPTLYPTGSTGYEPYYIDIQSFWRELYNPTPFSETADSEAEINERIVVLQNTLDSARARYDLYSDEERTSDAALELAEQIVELEKQISELENLLNFYRPVDNAERAYWAKAVYECPENLNFWIDFLDTGELIEKYNVKKLGFRTKSVNDNTVKSIYYREVPQVIYRTATEADTYMTGYRYIQIGNGYEHLFSISSQGVSAKEKLDELLQKHAYFIESSNITTFPIYHLEPNAKIRINSDKYKIYGIYEVTKFSIPLAHSGTMSLSVTKDI